MMKYFAFTASLLFLIVGCTPPQETRFVDEDFGKAQLAAWDQQIINHDNPYGAIPPEGMEGNSAEEIMKVYNDTFKEKTKKETMGIK